MSNFAPEGARRFMLKFYFLRLEEPHMSAQPSWDHQGDGKWRPVDGPGQDDDAAEATWRWLLGESAVQPTAAASSAASIAASVSMLEEDNEEPTERQRIVAIFDSARAVAAAAATASTGDGQTGRNEVAEALLGVLSSRATTAAVDGILSEAWSHSTNEFRGPRRQSKACNPSGTNPADLDAMHALAAAGAPALPLLMHTLRDVHGSEWWVRAAAAAAIGSLGPSSCTVGVAEALAEVLANEDEEIWVRRNCAESLGYVISPDAPAAVARPGVHALMQALKRDEEEHEQLEYDQPESYMETVRQAAAASMARLAVHPCAEDAARSMHDAFIAASPHKLNAVTRWSCLVALQRMGTPEAEVLLGDAIKVW